MDLKALGVLFALFLVISPVVFAEATTEQITAPLTKIYDLIKAIISVVAVIAITVAGARYMFSGDNLPAREASKNTLTYAIVGIMIVWIAPLLVSYLTAPAM